MFLLTLITRLCKILFSILRLSGKVNSETKHTKLKHYIVMKSKFFWAGLLLVASYGSFAQEVPSGDPGYSTSNYKHPNKAAAAAKKNKKGFPISENVAINRNYKQAGTQTTEKGLSIIRNQPKEEYLTWQNPKMPFTKKVVKDAELANDTIRKNDTTID